MTNIPIVAARCPSCHATFDASHASWCECIARLPSPSCPRCGTCLCRLPVRERIEFWNSASPQLVEARLAASRRRLIHELGSMESQRPKVLVVDDDEEIRLIAAFRIESMGYAVICAASAAEALAVIGGQHVDVMVTDALMPKTDGRELCRSVKTTHPSIKVIIMTSLYTAARYKTEAFRRFGADDYLAKPIDFALLRQSLGRLTRGRSMKTEGRRTA